MKIKGLKLLKAWVYLSYKTDNDECSPQGMIPKYIYL